MSNPLADKVIIITGGASGIGLACARQLAGLGSKVALVDLNDENLKTARASLIETGSDSAEILPLALNVTSEQDMQRMAEATVAAFGRIDALIACAGILRVGKQLKTIADTSINEWDTIIRTNLTGTFLSNRAVLKQMAAQKTGDIINMSSTSGQQGRPFDGPYCASKFGIIGLSESLEKEVSRIGIRVQTVLPDAVETPLWEQNGPAALKPGHTLAPERVADLIVYLLSLPRDTYVLNPVIAPLQTRRGRKKKRTNTET